MPGLRPIPALMVRPGQADRQSDLQTDRLQQRVP
jgi:hypothetical protein